MIDISHTDEIIVTKILKKHVPQCEVRVFGSRHKWTSKPYSDLDMAIVGDAKLDKQTLYALQEAFEESELNFRVDVLDWYAISDEFRAIIEQGYSVIQEKEIDNHLPDGWVVKKLGDVINIIGGGTPRTSNPDYWNGDIPWLSVKDFNNDNRYVFNTEKSITELGLSNSSTKMLSKDDIVISARGTVGEIAQLARNMAFNQSCYGIKANNYSCNNFIYYLLKYKVSELKSKSHGSVFDTITRATFDNLEINLPSLEEQKKIADILSSLDDKIELNQQINKKLEEMAQAIFKEWFIDFNFPDENGNPYRDSGGAMIDSELGLIPASWSVGKLGDMIGSVIDNRGKTPPIIDNGIPLLEVNAIEKDSQYPNWQSIRKFVTKETFDNWFRGHIRQNDILIPTVGTIGNLSLMDDNVACIAQNIVAIRPKDLYSSYYIFYLLKRSREFLLNLNIGGVQPSIKVPHLLNMQIIIPNIDIQIKFDLIVKSLSSKTNNQQIINLTNTRDTLLPKLISGEIRL